MTVLLIKASSPGWEKTFATTDEARVELLRHICAACLAGGEWETIDENGITSGIIPGAEPPPDQNDIRALLSTRCGCEYWLEEGGETVTT